MNEKREFGRLVFLRRRQVELIEMLCRFHQQTSLNEAAKRDSQALLIYINPRPEAEAKAIAKKRRRFYGIRKPIA